MLLLSVKPQQIDEALPELIGLTKGKCVVSIVTGLTSAYLQAQLGNDTYIVRTMPNTPIMLGFGATAISMPPEIPEDYREKAVQLFDGSGIVRFVPEEKIAEATCVIGSSPAYFFKMVETMVECAVAQGIEPETALAFAAKTMQGAAEMLLGSGKTPAELRIQVCSPGGTTLAALDAMEAGGFSNAISDGMLACTKRVYELSK